MPHKGYHQSNIHKKNRLESIQRYIDIHGNGWLGRKHNMDSRIKMRGPKSEAQKHKMSVAATHRWRKDKPGWVVNKPKVELVAPVVNRYVDIFMDNVEVDADGTIWYDVT